MRMFGKLPFVSSLCLVLGLAFTTPTILQAQKDSSFEKVRQANARLSQTVNSGFRATADTLSTLTARHDALEKVMRATPQQARSLMLDAATRATLVKAEPSYATLLEQDVPLTGELDKVIGDDFVNQTSQEHFILHSATTDRAMSFVGSSAGMDGLLRHQVTVKGISLSDVVAVESVRPALASEIESCAVPAAPQSSAPPLSKFGSIINPDVNTVPAGAATASCSITGNQTTAVIVLQFAGGTTPYDTTPLDLSQPTNWVSTFSGPAPSVGDYESNASSGQTTATVDYYGPITVPGVFDCTSTDAMATAAIAAITAAPAQVDVSKYNRLVLVYPVATCNFGGLDTLGCLAPTASIGHQYSVMWVPVTPGSTSAQAAGGILWSGLAHEYGHALGLNHASSLDFGALSLGPIDATATNTGTVAGAVTPQGAAPKAGHARPDVVNAAPGTTSISSITTEYGENFTLMGYPWNPAGPYSAEQQAALLGWIPAAGAQSVTASGNFTLNAVEGLTGLRALQVLRDPNSSSWIWIEFHQNTGTYEPLSLNGYGNNPGFSNTPNTFTNGASMRYQNGFGDALHTYLMNMAPVSVPNNFNISNLPAGSSWSDPYSLLTITAGTQGASTLPITVSYDTPCATVALSASQLAAAGGTGTVSITAPGTCAWTVAANVNWITFTGATSGTGNATVGFTYTANTAANQRNTYITAQRQSLPVVQPGTGVSILGLTPSATNVSPNVMTAYTFNVSDPAGPTADLGQLTVNFGVNFYSNCSVTVLNLGTGNSALVSVNGSNASITTGQNGQVANSFCTVDGPGSSFNVNGNTATVVLAVSFANAVNGVQPITGQAFSNGGQTTASLPLGYVTVAPITATVPTVTLTPGFGNTGTTVPVTITGVNTNFATGTTAVTITGPGANLPTVTGTTVTSATSLTTNIVIPTNASLGAYTVTVTTGAQTASTTFTVNQGAAPTITVTPSTINQGDTAKFTINGTNTNFTNATTVAVTPTGAITGTITVSNLTVVSPTQLTGTLTSTSTTGTGAWTVTATSGTEVDTATLTVLPGATPVITLSPITGAQGTAVPVTITGNSTAFAAGTTVAVTGPSTGVTVSGVTVSSATALSATLNIAGTAATGLYTVTVTTGASAQTATFTVTPGLTASATISPASGTANQTVTVTITGTNTSFSASSAITVSGTGITVNSVNPLNATRITAQFVIAGGAATGPRTVTVTTGAQVVTTTFNVQGLTATTSTLAASATSIIPAGSTVLSASVAPSTGNGTPTGLICFFDNTIASSPNLLATTSLVAGKASYTLSNLSVGAHSYTAQYLGDGTTYDVSTSAAVTVTVAKATPTVALSGVSAGTLSVAAATGLTLTATIGGGTTGVTPTGSVTFLDGTTSLGTGTLTAGVATLTNVTLAKGNHSISASYGGDGNFTKLASAAIPVAVGLVTPTATLTGVTAGTVFPASATGLTLTLTLGSAGSTFVPSGTVTFLDGATTLGTGTLNAGVATITSVTLATGAHSISASYGGDSNFNPLTSAAIAVSVQDFSIAASPTTLSNTGTQTTSTTITLTPGTGGFSSAIALSCSGVPNLTTCSVTPTTVTPGASNATATLTVTTVAAVSDVKKTGLAILIFGSGFGMIFMRRRKLMTGLLVALATITLGLAMGCGNGSPANKVSIPGSPAGTYTLTVTGTATGSTTLTHTTNVTLTVH